MIERLYLRDLVTFDEVELEFENGLVVLTGPSGAGKSVLMSAILSSFGHATQGAAALCEVNLTKPSGLKSDAYELEDDLTVKTLKKEKLRYFIDGQNISKKALSEMILNKPFSYKACGRTVRNHILAVVYSEEKNVNLELIKAGLAEVYRGKLPDGFNIEPYEAAENEAKKAAQGIWSLGSVYISPIDWRKANQNSF